ncbi:MAG: AAA family ATPase [Desulfurococcales archaeon]|jgi:ABC-type transporter Mla maintaining outer membrane lipid asymmetry ATPase subunit MlaF|nr:AAA family ATPase [Desulfurococcales archaeon]
MYNVRFILGDLSEGEFNTKDLTVLMGPPGSGKTALMRIIHNAVSLYRKDLEIYVDSELREFANIFEKIEIEINSEDYEERLIIKCAGGKSFEEAACDSEGSREFKRQTYMIPHYFDPVLRFTLFFPFQGSDMKFMLIASKMLNEGLPPRNIPSELKEILNKLGDKLYSNRFKIRFKRFFETINGKEIPASISAASFLRVGLLIHILLYIARDEPLVMLDEPDIGLHPSAVKQLALFLHILARKNMPIIVATHNLFFLDALRNINKIFSEFDLDLEPAEMSLVIMRKVRKKFKAENIDPASSNIESYVNEILKIYT